MLNVELRWPEALLIELFVGHRDNEIAARTYETPPLIQCVARVVHVLETVRAMDRVEARAAQIAQDFVRVTMVDRMAAHAARRDPGLTRYPIRCPRSISR